MNTLVLAVVGCIIGGIVIGLAVAYCIFRNPAPYTGPRRYGKFAWGTARAISAVMVVWCVTIAIVAMFRNDFPRMWAALAVAILPIICGAVSASMYSQER